MVDELLTLLKARGNDHHVVPAGEAMFEAQVARQEWVTHDDVLDAWYSIRTFRGKWWNFTDCVSSAVMRRLGIERAIAFDHQFRQFGTVEVLP